MTSSPALDFALSYAGENRGVADNIARRLRELHFSVFYAEDQKHLLAGVDGEEFFEYLFREAKIAVVLVSAAYRAKEWPRYEWDVLRRNGGLERVVPVRLDETEILGLPSSIMYVPFDENDFEPVIRACVAKLSLFEAGRGIKRPTEYERILDAIKNDSKGALAQAYQLVVSGRTRTPLADIEVPRSEGIEPEYRVISEEWPNLSLAVRRMAVKVVVPRGMAREVLRFNLMHCCAVLFNQHKPDALMVLAYFAAPGEKVLNLDWGFTAGRAVLAPFGNWDKAQDGVAYDLPTSDFSYSIDYASRVE